MTEKKISENPADSSANKSADDTSEEKNNGSDSSGTNFPAKRSDEKDSEPETEAKNGKTSAETEKHGIENKKKEDKDKLMEELVRAVNNLQSENGNFADKSKSSPQSSLKSDGSQVSQLSEFFPSANSTKK